MNTHEHQRQSPQSTTATDLDQVLRAYFRAQVPDPWPPLQVPHSPSWWSAARSRLALAAAIALMLLGSWWILRTAPLEYPVPVTGLPGDIGTGSKAHGPIIDRVGKMAKNAPNPRNR